MTLLVLEYFSGHDYLVVLHATPAVPEIHWVFQKRRVCLAAMPSSLLFRVMTTVPWSANGQQGSRCELREGCGYKPCSDLLQLLVVLKVWAGIIF